MSTQDPSLKYILEALLMSSSEPLNTDAMLTVFAEWEKPTQAALTQALEALREDYQHRAIELVQLSSGYCFQTKATFSAWIGKLLTDKPAKYSHAFFEILSIIAYKQPVTRAEIEEIRGVTVSTPILKTLLDREWIRTVGYRDVVGKPALYATTQTFLNDFNLATLADLPLLGES